MPGGVAAPDTIELVYSGSCFRIKQHKDKQEGTVPSESVSHQSQVISGE